MDSQSDVILLRPPSYLDNYWTTLKAPQWHITSCGGETAEGSFQNICERRQIVRQTEEAEVGTWYTFATHAIQPCWCIWTRHWGQVSVWVMIPQQYQTGCRRNVDDICLLTTSSCWFTHRLQELLLSVWHEPQERVSQVTDRVTLRSAVCGRSSAYGSGGCEGDIRDEHTHAAIKVHLTPSYHGWSSQVALKSSELSFSFFTIIFFMNLM